MGNLRFTDTYKIKFKVKELEGGSQLLYMKINRVNIDMKDGERLI